MLHTGLSCCCDPEQEVSDPPGHQLRTQPQPWGSHPSSDNSSVCWEQPPVPEERGDGAHFPREPSLRSSWGLRANTVPLLQIPTWTLCH